MAPTVQSIVDKVNQLLDSEQGQRQVERLRDHFDRLHDERDNLCAQVARLGKRPGVAFYARVGTLTSNQLLIDVRIAGTSCGEVALVPGRKERRFTPSKKFACHFPGKFADWGQAQVGKYLQFVADLARSKPREAAVESALLIEMAKSSSKRKPPLLHWHQPVKLAKLPFQFPLPINAREAPCLPRGTAAGHADVLARARQDGALRLRVFEVKKHGASDIDHALDQAVTYCAALEHLIQHFPATYFSAFGFSSPRRQLPLDAVAFVSSSPNARPVLQTAADRLADGGSRFGLCAQFFRWEESAGSRALVIEEEQRYV